MQLSAEEFAKKAKPYVIDAGFDLPEHYPAIAASVQEKVKLFTEVPNAISFYLNPDYAYDPTALEKVKSNESAPTLLEKLAQAFSDLSDWSSAKELIGATAKENGAKPGQLMFPTRVALSGQAGGPDLGAILEILGQSECVRRIRRTINELS